MTCFATSVALLAAGAAATGAAASPAAAATSPCTVTYSVTNSWPGGFQAGITITNNAAAITSWTLGFTFGNNQVISNGWDGTYTQNGPAVTGGERELERLPGHRGQHLDRVHRHGRRH